MSTVNVTLRNYRCFDNEQPAVFEIGSGFTAFVGMNNAGKSTCLRMFWELRSFLANASHFLNGSVSSGEFDIMNEREPRALIHNFLGQARVSFEFTDLHNESTHTIVGSQYCFIPKDNRMHGVLEHLIVRPPTGNSWPLKVVQDDLQGYQFATVAGPRFIKSIRKPGIELRTDQYIDSMQTLAKARYYGAHRNTINQGGFRHYDIAVGTTLIQEWRDWKGGTNLDHRNSTIKVQNVLKRILGMQSLEINANADATMLNVDADGIPHKLDDLGAGVSELFATLASAAIQKPTYLLVDEPELHLHPALQKDNLLALGEFASHGVAITTHSLGLARSTSERIFSVQKLASSNSVVAPFAGTQSASELLGSLSYSNYFPLGGGHILLVEGPTDVPVFQVLFQKLRIDHKVIVLPLGGRSMINGSIATQLEEIRRIVGDPSRIFSIVDSERQSDADEPLKPVREFCDVCVDMGINCHLTKRRATENYMSREALSAAFGKDIQPLGPFEKLDGRWSKGDSWKAAAKEGDTFWKTDVGDALKKIEASVVKFGSGS